ncbi:hypothetical protein IEQ34_010892 [Dendrobium chrysotoxum]|uniref:Uncharacterized protein n=1 Tax=Dendrobium chrysotoxum TaxID=161865 RepID=A0AAV7GEK9_DENCH|nr:hypothetical protein IEQ34_010892 [Dendrobium chrysotoxum]
MERMLDAVVANCRRQTAMRQADRWGRWEIEFYGSNRVDPRRANYANFLYVSNGSLGFTIFKEQQDKKYYHLIGTKIRTSLDFLEHGHHIQHRRPPKRPIIKTSAGDLQMLKQLKLQSRILFKQMLIKNVPDSNLRMLLNPSNQVIFPEIRRVGRLATR